MKPVFIIFGIPNYPNCNAQFCISFNIAIFVQNSDIEKSNIVLAWECLACLAWNILGFLSHFQQETDDISLFRYYVYIHRIFTILTLFWSCPFNSSHITIIFTWCNILRGDYQYGDIYTKICLLHNIIRLLNPLSRCVLILLGVAPHSNSISQSPSKGSGDHMLIWLYTTSVRT